MGIEEIRRLKSQPKQKKEPKPIKKVAAKRQVELMEYDKLREIFLKQRPLCELQSSPKCTIKATEVQHGAGRENKRLLDVTKWKATCHNCHVHDTEHTREAIDAGRAYSRLNKK
jgi:hypothetical protein